MDGVGLETADLKLLQIHLPDCSPVDVASFDARAREQGNRPWETPGIPQEILRINDQE